MAVLSGAFLALPFTAQRSQREPNPLSFRNLYILSRDLIADLYGCVIAVN